MDNPLILLGLVLVVAVAGYALRTRLFKSRKGKPAQVAASLSYEKIASLLTPAERDFYRYLAAAVADEWWILAKIKLADLVKPAAGGKGWRSPINRTNQEYVDFVLCTHDALTPVLVIELDDSSDKRPDRHESDKAKASILQAAGLPLVSVAVHESYPVQQLALEIRSTINASTAPVAMVAPDPAFADVDMPTQQLSEANLPAQPQQSPKQQGPRTKPKIARIWIQATSAILGLIIVLSVLARVSASPDSLDAPLAEAAGQTQAEPTQANNGADLVLPPDTSASVTATPEAPAQLAEATVAAKGLHMRSGPGTQYESIGTFEIGTRLNALGKDSTETWVKVGSQDGLVGWMAAKYLTLSVPLASLPPVN